MYARQFYDLLVEDYSLVLATTDEELVEVKKIREEVYSIKYNKPISYLESINLILDKDDEQSFIYLLKHNKTDQYIGTVRMFFLNNKTNILKLPMQQTVTDEHIFDYLHNLPVIEISRLALKKSIPTHSEYSDLRLRTTLTLGLMVATRIILFLYPSDLVFSIIEPALHRILRRQKVNFEKISDTVDSYGTQRIPCAIKREKLLYETESTMEKLTKYYLKQMCQNPEKLWNFIDNNIYLDRSDIQLERICKLFKEYGDDVDIALLLGENKD